MKKLILLFLILVVSPVFALNFSEKAMTGNYTVVIEENGDAQVTLNINGSGTMNLPLPLDVVSPSVDDALYIQALNGIDVSVGLARHALVTYRTSLLTTRQSGIWGLEMELPRFDSVSVSMTLPKNVEIIQTSPQAWITQPRNSTELLWDVKPEGNDTITVQYRFVQKAPPQIYQPSPRDNETVELMENGSRPTPSPIINGTTVAPENTSENLIKPIIDEKSEVSWWKNLLVLIILVSILSISLYYYIKMRNKSGKKITRGVENVIKTFSENEHTIVNTLLQNNGEMKRNRLEKTTGLAKSSLASSLYGLERKNIVEIDRSGAVHYVRLTDWFKSL